MYDEEMARRGRPPKKRVMDAQFNLRLYQEVLDAFRTASEKDGKSLGAWLTWLGLRRAKRLGIEPHEPDSSD